MRSNNFALQLAAKFSQITLHHYCSDLPTKRDIQRMSFFVVPIELTSYDNEVNRRRLFNYIIDERIRWMKERGEDGVAVEQTAKKRRPKHRKSGWRGSSPTWGATKTERFR